MPRTLPSFALLVVVALVGCDSGLTYHRVKGKVTFDSKSIETGVIEFDPVDRNTPSAKGGAIKNGEYTADIPAGEWTVRISADRVTGKRKMYEQSPDSPWTDITEQYLPKKYNEQSELKVRIDSKRDDLNFDLKSQ